MSEAVNLDDVFGEVADITVTCALCTKTHKGFRRDMAMGCSSEVGRSTLTGHFGSTIADMTTYDIHPIAQGSIFVPGDIVCDACITLTCDQGFLTKQAEEDWPAEHEVECARCEGIYEGLAENRAVGCSAEIGYGVIKILDGSVFHSDRGATTFEINKDADLRDLPIDGMICDACIRLVGHRVESVQVQAPEPEIERPAVASRRTLEHVEGVMGLMIDEIAQRARAEALADAVRAIRDVPENDDTRDGRAKSRKAVERLLHNRPT